MPRKRHKFPNGVVGERVGWGGGRGVGGERGGGGVGGGGEKGWGGVRGSVGSM